MDGAVRSRGGAVVDVLPGALAVVATVWGLLALGTPAWDLLRYGLALGWAVLLPGVLVHRALRGAPPLLVADLALGAATGVGLNLGAWALSMVLGVPGWLRLWPLLVVVPFVVVRGLRRHWRRPEVVERSRPAAWLLTGAYLLHAAVALTGQRALPLPPRANAYYIDVYWHLDNAAELSSRFPPEVPSVAGRTLRYHWFSNADMAANHLVSGVDLSTIVLRLWPLPVTALVLGLLVALARSVTGAAWPGGAAALFVVAPPMLMPWEWFRTVDANALVAGSPSQDLGLVPTLLGAVLLVDLVRRRLTAGGWALLVLATVLGVGAKPSVAPTLLGGVVVAAVLLRRRREPVRGLLAAGAVLAGGIVVLAPLVAQSAAASGVKLFGQLAFSRVWTGYAAHVDLPATGGPLLAGLRSPGALLLALGLVAALLLQVAWVLCGLAVRTRGVPVDPAVAVLGGAVASALLLTLVVDHAGQSEIYFEKTAVPLAAVLAVWGLRAALTRSVPVVGRRGAVALAAAGVVVGLVVHAVVDASARGGPSAGGEPLAVATPLVVLAVLSLGAFLLWRVVRGARPWLRLVGQGPLVACAAVLALFGVQGTVGSVSGAWAAATGPAPVPRPAVAVSAEESEAALWVREHTDPDAVLATNVHCRFGLRWCDSRAYWVTSLSERRALVESWAYTEENLDRIGTFRTGFPLFPFDDPDLLALNDRAFTAPTPQVLAELRDRHGVSYLFADTRAGAVSPLLRGLADLRHESGPVQVYALRP